MQQPSHMRGKICGARTATYRKWIFPVASGRRMTISTLCRASIVFFAVASVTVILAGRVRFYFRSDVQA
jgi:hypothetical protein